MSPSIQSSNSSEGHIITLWYCGRCVGRLGVIMTDQPWLFADVVYDNAELAAQLERVSYFINVLIEQMPDFEDAGEDDRHYCEALESEGLTESLVDGFKRGPWEIRCDREREELQVHSLQDGTAQWRGPMGPVVKRSKR